jgi:hypothetical protein
MYVCNEKNMWCKKCNGMKKHEKSWFANCSSMLDEVLASANICSMSPCFSG